GKPAVSDRRRHHDILRFYRPRAEVIGHFRVGVHRQMRSVRLGGGTEGEHDDRCRLQALLRLRPRELAEPGAGRGRPKRRRREDNRESERERDRNDASPHRPAPPAAEGAVGGPSSRLGNLATTVYSGSTMLPTRMVADCETSW